MRCEFLNKVAEPKALSELSDARLRPSTALSVDDFNSVGPMTCLTIKTLL
jgi:hypothetical protein